MMMMWGDATADGIHQSELDSRVETDHEILNVHLDIFIPKLILIANLQRDFQFPSVGLFKIA